MANQGQSEGDQNKWNEAMEAKVDPGGQRSPGEGQSDGVDESQPKKPTEGHSKPSQVSIQ